jgi:hypothetical protein
MNHFSSRIEPVYAVSGRPSFILGESAGTKDTAVIIATRGRPEIVARLVESLAGQSLPPAHTFVIGSRAEDIAGFDRCNPGVTLQVGRVGSALQRNDGLTLAGGDFAYIVFSTTISFPRGFG